MTDQDNPFPPPSPPTPQWCSLITLKGQNGQHNEADRGPILQPPFPHPPKKKNTYRNMYINTEDLDAVCAYVKLM